MATRTKATNTDDNSKASNESTSKTSNESNSKTSNESNPKTGDNVLFYVSMLGLSIIGLIGAGLYTKKKILK